MKTLWHDPHARKLLILFIFVVLIFAALSIRQEIQQSETRRLAETVQKQKQEDDLESCQGGLAIIEQFNESQTELANLDRRSLNNPSSPLTPLQVDIFTSRIQIYLANQLPVPDCSRLPGG